MSAVDAGGTAHAGFLVVVGASWRDPDDGAYLAWAEATWDDRRASDATREAFYPGFPGVVDGEERPGRRTATPSTDWRV